MPWDFDEDLSELEDDKEQERGAVKQLNLLVLRREHKLPWSASSAMSRRSSGRKDARWHVMWISASVVDSEPWMRGWEQPGRDNTRVFRRA
jgi:hypothetical protein